MWEAGQEQRLRHQDRQWNALGQFGIVRSQELSNFGWPILSHSDSIAARSACGQGSSQLRGQVSRLG